MYQQITFQLKSPHTLSDFWILVLFLIKVYIYSFLYNCSGKGEILFSFTTVIVKESVRYGPNSHKTLQEINFVSFEPPRIARVTTYLSVVWGEICETLGAITYSSLSSLAFWLFHTEVGFVEDGHVTQLSVCCSSSSLVATFPHNVSARLLPLQAHISIFLR